MPAAVPNAQDGALPMGTHVDTLTFRSAPSQDVPGLAAVFGRPLINVKRSTVSETLRDEPSFAIRVFTRLQARPGPEPSIDPKSSTAPRNPLVTGMIRVLQRAIATGMRWAAPTRRCVGSKAIQPASGRKTSAHAWVDPPS